MGHMNRASLYLRLSSASTDDKTGLGTQESDLRALAARNGLDVVAVHIDDGLSGALRDRPGFLAWLADAREGRADHLLAWKLDRVSRGGSAGLARFLDVLEGVDQDGRPVGPRVRFLSHADSLDSAAPGWDIQAAVLGAIAKGERDATRTRMLRHREANRASGRIVGGRRPWPFRPVPRDGGGMRWEPIPERAEMLVRALERLRDGESLSNVARMLERSVSSTRRLLASPVLYGAHIHHGDVVRNADHTVRVDPGQAILTLPEWRELQGLIAARSAKRSDPTLSSALLAGILHCGACGRVMYPHRPASGKLHTYRCRGGDCLRPVSIAMRDVEPYLEQVFYSSIGSQTPPARTVTVYTVDSDEVLRLQDGLASVERALSGDLSDDDALAALRARRELRDRLKAAQGVAPEVSRERDMRTYAEQYDDAREAGDVAEQNRLLDLALDHVVILPGKRGHFDPERVQVTGPPEDYI